MGNRVVLIRHSHTPNDDRVVNYITKTGFIADIRKPFAGDAIPEITEDIAATVIYGGPYPAFDTKIYPFLKDEYRWLDAALETGLPTLGLCQGAQMIAHHYGKWVGPLNPEYYEFGYYELTSTGVDPNFIPDSLCVSQYHFHTFDLPDEAIHLARSEAYENQAFQIGHNTYGFQFHPEVTIEGFRRWQENSDENFGKTGAQDKITQDNLMQVHDAKQARWFHNFLETFLGQPN